MVKIQCKLLGHAGVPEMCCQRCGMVIEALRQA